MATTTPQGTADLLEAASAKFFTFHVTVECAALNHKGQSCSPLDSDVAALDPAGAVLRAAAEHPEITIDHIAAAGRAMAEVCGTTPSLWIRQHQASTPEVAQMLRQAALAARVAER